MSATDRNFSLAKPSTDLLRIFIAKLKALSEKYFLMVIHLIALKLEFSRPKTAMSQRNRFKKLRLMTS
jgi:hypothetical protein